MAGMIGLLSGAVMYFIGMLTCALTRSRALAVLVTLLFAIPAASIGYHLGAQLGRLLFVAHSLQLISALAMAVLVLILSWRRLGPMERFDPIPNSSVGEARKHTTPVIDATFTKMTDAQHDPSASISQGNQFRFPLQRKILLDLKTNIDR